MAPDSVGPSSSATGRSSDSSSLRAPTRTVASPGGNLPLVLWILCLGVAVWTSCSFLWSDSARATTGQQRFSMNVQAHLEHAASGAHDVLRVRGGKAAAEGAQSLPPGPQAQGADKDAVPPTGKEQAQDSPEVPAALEDALPRPEPEYGVLANGAKEGAKPEDVERYRAQRKLRAACLAKKDQPRFHMLTVANKNAGALCYTVESAAQNRINVTVMNWGGVHKGHGAKLFLQEQYLAGLDPCDVVMFVDGLDVLFGQGEEALLQRILDMEKADDEFSIWFGAECGCWPQAAYPDGTNICSNLYPRSPTRFRYLNTGIWFGRAWAAREVLGQVSRGLSNVELTGAENDQEIISGNYWNRRSDVSMSLDYHMRVGGNCHSWPGCDMVDVLQSNGNGKGDFLLPDLGTTPGVLHFNGGSKNAVNKIRAGMWYRLPAGSFEDSQHPAPLTRDELAATSLFTPLYPPSTAPDGQPYPPPDRPEFTNVVDFGCRVTDSAQLVHKDNKTP
ncbi:let-268 [Symbiodinium sp. KB8]|nr:let-268 [Symbiodinium sp. KB8]